MKINFKAVLLGWLAGMAVMLAGAIVQAFVSLSFVTPGMSEQQANSTFVQSPIASILYKVAYVLATIAAGWISARATKEQPTFQAFIASLALIVFLQAVYNMNNSMGEINLSFVLFNFFCLGVAALIGYLHESGAQVENNIASTPQPPIPEP